MKNKFIKTRAVFANELEGLGIDQSYEDRLSPFRFKPVEVVAYNESSHEGWATIWLMGTSITIEMSVDELDDLFKDQNLPFD